MHMVKQIMILKNKFFCLDMRKSLNRDPSKELS